MLLLFQLKNPCVAWNAAELWIDACVFIAQNSNLICKLRSPVIRALDLLCSNCSRVRGSNPAQTQVWVDHPCICRVYSWALNRRLRLHCSKFWSDLVTCVAQWLESWTCCAPIALGYAVLIQPRRKFGWITHAFAGFAAELWTDACVFIAQNSDLVR
jgi:hypothetical protein